MRALCIDGFHGGSFRRIHAKYNHEAARGISIERD